MTTMKTTMMPSQDGEMYHMRATQAVVDVIVPVCYEYSLI